METIRMKVFTFEKSSMIFFRRLNLLGADKMPIFQRVDRKNRVRTVGQNPLRTIGRIPARM